MEYSIKEFTIKYFYQLIKDNKINLRPSYQRNYVWGKKDQQALIDSILKGWPLPTFFLYKKPNGLYEVVDGQQRAETICRFIKGIITSSDNKTTYDKIDSNSFLSYRLNIVEITNVRDDKGEDIAEFYALVNKQGAHLNQAEVNKAQYAQHPFLKLAEELLLTPEVSKLDIFTDRTKNRMNDRTLIEELVAYLRDGIFDKRESVNDLYKSSITEKELVPLKDTFSRVLKRLELLNAQKPINKTRYCQRNDFFTLFTYINEHLSILTDELLKYQYGLLCWIDDNELIRPSNDECELLQRYAFACVTQSNSKESRKTRLKILETLLLNESNTYNNEYERFLEDIKDLLNRDDIPEKNICGYILIDYNKLNSNQ